MSALAEVIALLAPVAGPLSGVVSAFSHDLWTLVRDNGLALLNIVGVIASIVSGVVAVITWLEPRPEAGGGSGPAGFEWPSPPVPGATNPSSPAAAPNGQAQAPLPPAATPPAEVGGTRLTPPPSAAAPRPVQPAPVTPPRSTARPVPPSSATARTDTPAGGGATPARSTMARPAAPSAGASRADALTPGEANPTRDHSARRQAESRPDSPRGEPAVQWRTDHTP